MRSGLVPPGAEKPSDLAHIDKPPADSDGAALILAVNPMPADNRYMSTSLRVEAELTVTARNADQRDYRLEAFCDGAWGDNPWDHLAINP